jgi:hypothetical protein
MRCIMFSPYDGFSAAVLLLVTEAIANAGAEQL